MAPPGITDDSLTSLWFGMGLHRDFGALGDISTLADPSVVENLIAERMNKG